MIRTIIKRLGLHLVLPLLPVLLLSACGLTSHQIIKTQSFGSATASMGKLGEEEFINIRRDIIAMNKELVAIDNSKLANSLNFDKAVPAEDTSKRVAASKALKLYGELLSQLASEDRTEDLQKSANALLDATSTALKDNFPDDKKSALTSVVAGFGSLWIARKKADAAKRIVLAYQQPVKELVELLQHDFSLEDDAEGYIKAYDVTAKRLKNASMRLVNAGDKYSVLERDRAVQALVLSETNITRVAELSNKAKNALKGLQKANVELVSVMNNQKYTTDDIKEYARQVQELVNSYQVLSK